MLKVSTVAVPLLLAAPLALVAGQSDPATAPPPPAAPTQVATANKPDPDYQVGSVVTVYELKEQNRQPLNQGQPIGSFVSESNPWNLGLHKQQPALAFFQGKPLGYEADSYFVAKEAGNYSFGVEVDLPPAVLFADPDHLRGGSGGWIDCHYRLTVAGETLIDMDVSTRARDTQEQDRHCGLTQHGFGTVQLEPGLHRTRQWLACTGERRLRGPLPRFTYPAGCPQVGKSFNTDNFPGDEARVTVRVRHPQDNTPMLVKASEFVHEKR